MDFNFISVLSGILGAIVIIAIIIASTTQTLVNIIGFFFNRERYITKQYGAVIEKATTAIAKKLGLLRHANRIQSFSLYLDSESIHPYIRDKYVERAMDIISERIRSVNAKVGISTIIGYDYYVDLRGALTDAKIASEVGDILITFIGNVCKETSISFNCVASHRNGSTVLGYRVAQTFGLPLLLVTSESRWSLNDKDIYVESNNDFGAKTVELEALLIDDSCSGGATLLESATKLLREGIKVRHAFVIFKRREDNATELLAKLGITLHSVLSITDKELADIIKRRSNTQRKIEFSPTEQIDNYQYIPFSLKRLNLYVNLSCPIRCRHCCVGPKLDHNEMPLQEALDYLKIASPKPQSLKELMILGGEPTIYPYLQQLVDKAVENGIKEISVCTGGYDYGRLIPIVDKLHHVTISLDGFTKDIHDKIRYSGSFENTVEAIKHFVASNVRVQVIFTANAINSNDIISGLDKIEQLGVEKVNYHVISENGFARRNVDLLIKPALWRNVYDLLDSYQGQMKLKYPMKYATRRELDEERKQGYDCMLHKINRINLLPGGQCYACCLFIDSNLPVGQISNKLFTFKNVSEISIAKEALGCSCPAEEIILGSKPNDDLIPVCVHWKREK